MTTPFVLLDSTPLGLLCGPDLRPDVVACRQWAEAMQLAGHLVIIPEIIDYELRRELIRANRIASADRLTHLRYDFAYLPLNTDAMEKAAELWAGARQTGRPTAGDDTIDIDMILIAQAMTMQLPNAVIATANLCHLQPFFPTDLWTNITP